MDTEIYLGGKSATFNRSRDVMLLAQAIARGQPVYVVNSRTGHTIDIVSIESEAKRVVDKGNHGRGYDEARVYKRYPNGFMLEVYQGKTTVTCGKMGDTVTKRW